MEEDPVLAAKFSNKSIAEQHSVTLAWDIFMADEYKNLREVMFATKAGLMRFRQLLVNIVLATDIFDRELVCIVSCCACITMIHCCCPCVHNIIGAR